MDSKQKVRQILGLLKKKYPSPKTALRYKSPFELLASTILSAQSTDEQVNRTTSTLFRKYRSIKDYASVPLEELQKDVSSINFYRNKAKYIQNCAKTIMERFGSKVPKTMEELITLPGVARKTANIVLSAAYGINDGIAVDTHVKRLSNRLGLSKHKDPVKIEQDLMAATPKKEWAKFSFLLILHGRDTCSARKPIHDDCVLKKICPSRDI
jgi:endonuclease-3